MEIPTEAYRRLLDHFPTGLVFVYESDGDDVRYTLMGGEGVAELGMDPDDLEGSPVAENRPPEIRDTIVSKYKQALDGEQVTFQTEAEGRHFLIRLTPFPSDDGTIDYGLGVAQDITERVVYEQEIKRLNRRLDNFAETLAHDLRNPLDVATTRLELLADESDSEHIEIIERSHERIETLIDGLLDQSYEMDWAELEPISLEETVQAAWHNVETHAATLDVIDSESVCADPSDLRRLFENLFRNSVEHGGESVTVRVGTLADGFYVEDDGPGIPEHEREDVFERSFTTDDGTGLGLFIVSTVVEAHGWSITVTEGTDGGARFEITDVEFVNSPE